MELKLKSNTEEVETKEKVFKLIDDKKVEFMKFDNHLNDVSDIIKQINKFIDGKVGLSNDRINGLLRYLVQYRVVLDIPIPKNTLLLRGVKLEKPMHYPYKYTNTSRVSYIPETKSDKAKLGRFNFDAQPMYYGSISSSILSANVVFSEIEAKEKEYINLLVSKTIKELKVRYIGLFDYYKRNTKPPFNVHSFFEDVYKYYVDTHELELLSAIELCDTFFSDITTRKGSSRLYMVTSTLANILLERDVDGLIYPSVSTPGSPNLVLKPSSVDEKIQHEKVHVKMITKDYGYSLYYAIDNDTGIVDKDNNIKWNTK